MAQETNNRVIKSNSNKDPDVTVIILSLLDALLSFLNYLQATYNNYYINKNTLDIFIIIIFFTLLLNILLQNKGLIKRKNTLYSLFGLILAVFALSFVNLDSAETKPRIQAEAFVDRIQADTGLPNGEKDLYDEYLKKESGVYITFTPSQSHAEMILYDTIAEFHNFQPGEKVVIKICGIEKVIRTHGKSDPAYKLIYSAEFAIPANILDDCE